MPLFVYNIGRYMYYVRFMIKAPKILNAINIRQKAFHVLKV